MCEVWEIWQWKGTFCLKRLRITNIFKDGFWNQTNLDSNHGCFSQLIICEWAWNHLPHRVLEGKKPKAVTISLDALVYIKTVNTLAVSITRHREYNDEPLYNFHCRGWDSPTWKQDRPEKASTRQWVTTTTISTEEATPERSAGQHTDERTRYRVAPWWRVKDC